MHHHAPIIRTMPMSRSRRTYNHITRPNPPRLLSLIAYPSTARFDLENLSSLMRVPERATTREESHVVGHDAGLGVDVDDVHPDVAREGLGGFASGWFVSDGRGGRVGDDCGWHGM